MSTINTSLIFIIKSTGAGAVYSIVIPHLLISSQPVRLRPELWVTWTQADPWRAEQRPRGRATLDLSHCPSADPESRRNTEEIWPHLWKFSISCDNWTRKVPNLLIPNIVEKKNNRFQIVLVTLEWDFPLERGWFRYLWRHSPTVIRVTRWTWGQSWWGVLNGTGEECHYVMTDTQPLIGSWLPCVTRLLIGLKSVFIWDSEF